MATAKEIRGQIGSIKNTQKITRAMEMVAASKMRRAEDRKRMTEPYAQKMRTVIGHLAKGHSEYHHPYLTPRGVDKVGIIVVSSDRGLCGGLNNNLFKKVSQDIQKWQEKRVHVYLCTIGQKAVQFFKRFGGDVVGSAAQLGDNPAASDVVGVVKVMLDKYDAGEIDALYVASNEFENTMTQTPVIEKLLPVPATKDDKNYAHHWDYIYEPDAVSVIDLLLTRYIESQVYQAMVENIASEMAARMVAMKSASDNAAELIKELNLAYNKARQASITQELAEIVGGAEAV